MKLPRTIPLIFVESELTQNKTIYYNISPITLHVSLYQVEWKSELKMLCTNTF